MGIQLSDVNKIRQAWGDKPCDHPSVEKEYFNGADTGDYVCTQCGRVVDEHGSQPQQP